MKEIKLFKILDQIIQHAVIALFIIACGIGLYALTRCIITLIIGE
jgi:hypothetical protein